MVNPVYCYPKISYSISHIATDFSVEWMDKQVNNQADTETIRLMAAKYYVICQTKYDKHNQRKYGKTLKETMKLRELFRYLKSYISTDETKATTGK